MNGSKRVLAARIETAAEGNAMMVARHTRSSGNAIAALPLALLRLPAGLAAYGEPAALAFC